MANIRAEYAKRNGGNWFDPETLEFFGTEMHLSFFSPERNTFVFVTSEQQPDNVLEAFFAGEGALGTLERGQHPRRYTVRHMDVEGKISTLGPFCELSEPVAYRVASEVFSRGYSILDGGRMADLILRPDFAFAPPSVCHDRWNAREWADYMGAHGS